MIEPKWTQDETIAFECARECITHMMAICTRKIYDEERQTVLDEVRLAGLRAELDNLAHERAALAANDQDKISAIRREYGARIRAHVAQQRKSRETAGEHDDD